MPSKEATEKKTAAKEVAKKPAVKRTAAKKTAEVKAADLKKVEAKIAALAVEVGNQLSAQGAKISEIDAALAAVRSEISTLPVEMQEAAFAQAKKHIAENVPKMVRDQVYDMCDTILLYGMRDTVKGAVTWSLDMFKKLGGLFVRETTDKVKVEKKRHEAARRGEKKTKSEEKDAGIFGKACNNAAKAAKAVISIVPGVGRKQEPETAAAAS